MTDREELRIRVATAIRASYAQDVLDGMSAEVASADYVGDVEEWLGEADAAIAIVLANIYTDLAAKAHRLRLPKEKEESQTAFAIRAVCAEVMSEAARIADPEYAEKEGQMNRPDFSEAKCKDDLDWFTYPDNFFPDPPIGMIREQRKVCLGCPVRDLCLQEALWDDKMVGIWGGTGTDQRKKMRTKIRRMEQYEMVGV